MFLPQMTMHCDKRSSFVDWGAEKRSSCVNGAPLAEYAAAWPSAIAVGGTGSAEQPRSEVGRRPVGATILRSPSSSGSRMRRLNPFRCGLPTWLQNVVIAVVFNWPLGLRRISISDDDDESGRVTRCASLILKWTPHRRRHGRDYRFPGSRVRRSRPLARLRILDHVDDVIRVHAELRGCR